MIPWSPSEVVEFDTSTVQRIFLVLMVLFFGMAILGLIGEIRGWWNDVGEVMMTIGTVGGMLVGAATLSTGATQKQVRLVHSAVVDNGSKLDNLDKLDVITAELNGQTGVLDHQLQVLKEVRDRL